MNRSLEGKIKINSYADIVGGEEDSITEVELTELHPFKNHPFKVKDDKRMLELVESIKNDKVWEPGLVRPLAEGGYEIIAGHRRKRACELAGRKTMPVIIREMDDDDATMAMIDTNLRMREELLPSEKAYAYKMKIEVLSHQGKATSRQVGEKLGSAEQLGKNSGDSERQVHRYIRLTELKKELLDEVDAKKLKFNPREYDVIYAKKGSNIASFLTSTGITIKTFSKYNELDSLNPDETDGTVFWDGDSKNIEKLVNKFSKLTVVKFENATTKSFKNQVEKISNEKWKKGCKELVKNILRDQIVLNDAAYCYEDAHSVVFIIGVNGVGKTTSVGKLAALYKGDGRKTMVAAADTFRAGAIEQLRTWADRAGVDIIAHNEGSDPSAVVYDAVKAAKARKTDLLLIDTAGRLHNKKNLMDELAKMRRVIEREYPEAYVETMIVLDGSTGQNALEQARQFANVTEINGIILTKLDGTAKGGIAIAIMNELKCPIKYIGVGEKISDLQKFDPEEYINALFADFDVKNDTDIIMDSGIAGDFNE